MLYRDVPPIYRLLITKALVVHDVRCFGRMARQPGKSAYDRFHNCWVWFRTLEHMLEELGVVNVAVKNSERAEFKGFVNIKLSDGDKEQIAAADQTDLRGLIDNAAALLYEGYKLSFAYDKTSGSVQATLACWRDGHPDCGHAISSRHPDFDTALHSLLYKHFTVAKECWTEFAPPTPVTVWD